MKSLDAIKEDGDPEPMAQAQEREQEEHPAKAVATIANEEVPEITSMRLRGFSLKDIAWTLGISKQHGNRHQTHHQRGIGDPSEGPDGREKIPGGPRPCGHAELTGNIPGQNSTKANPEVGITDYIHFPMKNPEQW